MQISELNKNGEFQIKALESNKIVFVEKKETLISWQSKSKTKINHQITSVAINSLEVHPFFW